jgi:hypothetical protein
MCSRVILIYFLLFIDEKDAIQRSWMVTGRLTNHGEEDRGTHNCGDTMFS